MMADLTEMFDVAPEQPRRGFGNRERKPFGEGHRVLSFRPNAHTAEELVTYAAIEALGAKWAKPIAAKAIAAEANGNPQVKTYCERLIAMRNGSSGPAEETGDVSAKPKGGRRRTRRGQEG